MQFPLKKFRNKVRVLSWKAFVRFEYNRVKHTAHTITH